MSLVGFTGPAGTGKTFSLLRSVKDGLQEAPLGEDQLVLGLTFMHGSRRRLHERLASLVRRRFECHTFDRFAWRLVQRWRTRISAQPPKDLPEGTSKYDATCIEAARLLESSDVAKWVVRRFPVIVVDEFQDCSIERLAIIKALAAYARLFVAADEFQDLRASTANEAVAWLEAQGGIEPLTKIHRTKRPGLLAAALAVREGRAVISGVGFKLEAVPSSPLAASKITFLIADAGTDTIAVLSPVRPGTSTFVDEIVSNVSTKQYGKSRIGPYSLRWEETADATERQAIESLGLLETPDENVITADQVLQRSELVLSRNLAHWVQHQRRVRGRLSFGHGELRAEIQRAAQQRRAHIATTARRRVITIYQAKNREFDHVVLLWPYKASYPDMMARRLLYNALTRAKKSALVLVQDPKRERIKKPPFA